MWARAAAVAAGTVATETVSVALQVGQEKEFVLALANEMFRQARALNFDPHSWAELADWSDPLAGVDAEIVALVAHNLAGRLARAVGATGTEKLP